MSTSRFTLSPTLFRPILVAVRVWGIIATLNDVLSRSTTVRLMPSIAIETFFTTYYNMSFVVSNL